MANRATPEYIREKFLANIIFSQDGCWNWKSRISKTGYGELAIGKKFYLAHRLSHGFFKGPIPNGLVVDHLCRNRSCVNPDHLEAVTQRENVLRGEGPSGINGRKMMCTHGHELTGQNLYIDPRGRRECKACRQEAVQRYKEGRVNIG